MEKLVFSDGEKIGVFDGNEVKKFDSAYIARYRDFTERREKSDAWKYSGDGARFRGDYDVYRTRDEEVYAKINGVEWDGDKAYYSFSVNAVSGVYRKDLANEKAEEEHVFTSSDEQILSLHRAGKRIAVTIDGGGETSKIGILDPTSAELKTLTEGDSRDQNAFFSPTENAILFDSAGVGRTSNGAFTGKYAPSSICSLNLDTMEISEIQKSEKYSFVKPKKSQDGVLYCIRRPTKEKSGGNIFLDILLLPYRILQALVMFVQTFVVMFTGKSLTSQGSNPAKGRDTDSRKLFIDGNLVEAEKEMKCNKRYKDKDYGFIPMNWELVKFVDGKPVPVKKGVCDYALTRDGGLYCTNGKHIFYIKNGEVKKIADTEKCLSLATESTAPLSNDLFF